MWESIFKTQFKDFPKFKTKLHFFTILDIAAKESYLDIKETCELIKRNTAQNNIYHLEAKFFQWFLCYYVPMVCFLARDSHLDS